MFGGVGRVTTDWEHPERWHDGYRTCETACTHDLSKGVLVSELLDRDGPEDQHPKVLLPNPLRPLLERARARERGG